LQRRISVRTVGLIWAQSTSGVIGRDGGIPWRLPEDQARFKELTMGHTVVMGRLTWESLPAKVRPLPGRRNVVVTRQADYMADGEVVTTLEDAPPAMRLGDRREQIYAPPCRLRRDVR
jgi:dihydrofolate reductase